MSDHNEINGMIYLVDEKPEHVAIKYIIWLTIMILFVLVLMWFTSINKQKCNYDVYGDKAHYIYNKQHNNNKQHGINKQNGDLSYVEKPYFNGM